MITTSSILRVATVAAILLAGGHAARAGDYQLTVEEAVVDIGGKRVEKLTVNGGVPGPTLKFKEGEDARITVTNRTDEPTSVHWHGIMLPGMMDGSPGFNGFMGIAPGASYTYTFKIRQSGTYWYHSHSGTQDQSVLGAIVIEPAAPPPEKADRDYVLLLGDATAEDSDQVLRNLKADPGYYNRAKRTIGDFFADTSREGTSAAVKDRAVWGEMRMDPTDLADVTGYSFLVNGKSPEANETLIFRKGERIRLRFINGSAMTFFDVRIPGLKMTVVASDGNDVMPVTVDEFRMGVAERYDVIVEPIADTPYTVFAESLDRTGYARATLATAPGQQAAIPAHRPRALLTMDDMGASMPGMDHGGMDHGAGVPSSGGTDHSKMDHSKMDHSAMGHEAPAGDDQAKGWASGAPPGSRVLAYRDLSARLPNAETAAPTRTINVRLTGNMERYMWALNDMKFGDAEPIRVAYGERVRMVFTNETMMAHPMHLHGMFFELENGQMGRRPLKDTVIVPPGKSVSVVLTAREVGSWPLHCHLLYHMVSGMMTRFVVEPPGAADITPDGGAVTMTPHETGGHGGHANHGAAQ